MPVPYSNKLLVILFTALVKFVQNPISRPYRFPIQAKSSSVKNLRFHSNTYLESHYVEKTQIHRGWESAST